MFAVFSKSLYEKLIENEFYYAAKENESAQLSEDIKIITMMKQEGTALYVVNLINIDKMGLYFYEQHMRQYQKQLEERIEDLQYSHVIILNLLITQYNGEELYIYTEKEKFFPDQAIYIVPWIIDLNRSKLIISPSHTDQVLNIHQLIQKVLKGEREEQLSDIELAALEDEIRERTVLEAKSKTQICTYAIMAINIVIWIWMEFSGGSHSTDVLIRFGANEPTLIVENSEYWRLFTSMFLHIGIMHLLYNSFSLYLFGTRVEKYFGKAKFLSIYIASGLIGSVFSIFLSQTVSAGASGAIYGLLGAILALSQESNRRIDGLSNYILWIMILAGLALGFADISIDNFAHIGGLLMGYLLGLILHTSGKN